MQTATWVLILGLGIPAYAYLGYPVLLFVMAALVQMGRDVYYLLYRAERRTRGQALPSVTVLMAAYNEADVIERTLDNLAQLDYPNGQLEILVGSDGSSDGTVELAGRWSERGVRVLDFPERRGKMSVISDLAAAARGDILVLTDANTLIRPDAVRNLVRHFGDPSVGAVCGELRLVTPDGQRAEEGLYWRYEVTLKVLENRLNAVLGANGAIYAVRRPLFPDLSRDLITDDFVIPMTVRAAGHRVVYDPEAVAMEEAPASVSSEFRRRVRIGAGNWQALRSLRPPAAALEGVRLLRLLVAQGAALGHAVPADRRARRQPRAAGRQGVAGPPGAAGRVLRRRGARLPSAQAARAGRAAAAARLLRGHQRRPGRRPAARPAAPPARRLEPHEPPAAAEQEGLMLATVAIALLGCVALALLLLVQAKKRNAFLWLPAYVRGDWPGRREGPTSGAEGPTHVMFCIADHFEPGWRRADADLERRRVQEWVDAYPALFSEFRDADGRPPRHTFFFPVEQYRPEHFERLAELVRAGYGEVEVHLHHDNDTSEGLRRTLLDFAEKLAHHGLAGTDAGSGRARFAFVHGNWALDNSLPDGRWCGVNDELSVLRETGCYADFTLPAAPSPAQTRRINSIYYATDDPLRPKSHDDGQVVRAHGRETGDLMIVQGPLGIRWPGRFGLLPAIENGDLSAGAGPGPRRARCWVRLRVCVAGRPDWVFVKVHTHGCKEANMRLLLGPAMQTLHRCLCDGYNDGRRYSLHYVTAREMYNIIKAAEHGLPGSPGEYRNLAIAPPMTEAAP